MRASATSDSVRPMRRAEVLGTLALAADAGMGHPADLALRTAALASEAGLAFGLDAAARGDAYNLALLRFSGCTADTHLAADAFGDEVEARGWFATADFGKPIDVMRVVAGRLGEGEPWYRRARMIAHAFSRMSSLFDAARAHCEVAQRLSARLGFGAPMATLLGQVFERWDGRGIPYKLRGDTIAPAVLLVGLCHDVALFHKVGGREGALEVVRKRADGAYPASLVARFESEAAGLWEPLETPSAWDRALHAEPGPRHEYDERGIDEALAALADFADLKSRFTPGHSQRVAELAAAAARVLRCSDEEVAIVRRAAFVHDLGKAAVTASIWDKPGPLTDDEWEKVRLHAYVTGRCLGRVVALRAVADVAQSHHERLDGSGYHRQLRGDNLAPLMRLLGAADAYAAMTEDRAHRAALSPGEAAAQLRRDAARGFHARDAVEAVLAAAGHAVAHAPNDRFALSARESEVLQLLARGLTNKEIAQRLEISAKTAGHHVQHIYDKMGVSTRAAATMFAVENGLLRR
jgi:HD-GYP domain-containing protein (c-di-GMP phosphodiesterase class II)